MGADAATVYKALKERSQAAIAWYKSRAASLSRWAKTARWCGAVLATLGGLVPLVSMFKGQLEAVAPGIAILPSEAGYVLLALAGGWVFLNKVLGWTNGWMRCTRTRTKLESALDLFQLDWLEFGQDDSDTEWTVERRKLARRFLAGLHDTVKNETDAWAIAFSEGLSQLDGALGNGHGNGASNPGNRDEG